MLQLQQQLLHASSSTDRPGPRGPAGSSCCSSWIGELLQQTRQLQQLRIMNQVPGPARCWQPAAQRLQRCNCNMNAHAHAWAHHVIDAYVA